jgi:hypothetical protein
MLLTRILYWKYAKNISTVVSIIITSNRGVKPEKMESNNSYREGKQRLNQDSSKQRANDLFPYFKP